MKKLPILCAQQYAGVAEMEVTPCNRCSSGWSRELRRCLIDTGCEHMPLEEEAPTCPIQDRCQHELQQEGPCAVRARGMVCESALAYSGVERADEHPLAFNAMLL